MGSQVATRLELIGNGSPGALLQGSAHTTIPLTVTVTGRAVVNDLRLKIERDARIAEAAEDLAQGVQSVLLTVVAEPVDFDRMSFATLRAALTKFREATGRPRG